MERSVVEVGGRFLVKEPKTAAGGWGGAELAVLVLGDAGLEIAS